VGARSRRTLQVHPQDGRTLIGGDLFEADLLTRALAQRGSAAGSPHVFDPLDIVAEHGRQIALPIDADYD
jgi:hypothetical protein